MCFFDGFSEFVLIIENVILLQKAHDVMQQATDASAGKNSSNIDTTCEDGSTSSITLL